MSFHPDTSSRFWAIQYFPLLICDAYLEEKQQIPNIIVVDLTQQGFEHAIYYTWDEHAYHYTPMCLLNMYLII